MFSERVVQVGGSVRGLARRRAQLLHAAPVTQAARGAAARPLQLHRHDAVHLFQAKPPYHDDTVRQLSLPPPPPPPNIF